MASCLVPDFPAVLVALEHLGELGKQLKEEGIPFSPEASEHLKEIAAAITELEASRRAVHEQLEVETIETSKLRHKGQMTRDNVTKEITASVTAARAVNTEQITQLQQELNTIVEEIESTEKKQEEMERQNAVLIPQREMMKGQHKDVVDQLNVKLEMKAGNQITLNETRGAIHRLRVKVASVKQEHDDLLQHQKQRKETFSQTKATLEGEMETCLANITEQKRNNVKRSKDLDIMETKLQDHEYRISDLKTHVGQLERSIAKLAASEIQCEEVLKEEISKHKELLRLKKQTEEQSEFQEGDHQKIQSLQDDIATVDSEIAAGWVLNAARLDSIANVSETFMSQRMEEDEVKVEHLAIAQKLETSQQKLEERIASISKYRIEVKEMEGEMRQLNETNKFNVELFEKNLVELENQLAKEKKTIVRSEVQMETLCQSLEQLKMDHEEHVVKSKADIAATWSRYQELKDEEARLQEHLHMSTVIERLSGELVAAEDEYELLKRNHQEEIQEYMIEAKNVTKKTKEKETELEVKVAILEKVEAKFNVDESKHEILKNRTSELNIKKMHLNKSTEDLKQSTSSMLSPKERLKADLAVMRVKHLEVLANQARELHATERSIYENGLKLEKVNMENSRMHLCIEQMKEDIHNANKSQERHTQEIVLLNEEVHSLFEKLLIAWEQDIELIADCQEGDRQILEAIHQLMGKIHTRKLGLEDINAKLNQKLHAMTALLAGKKV